MEIKERDFNQEAAEWKEPETGSIEIEETETSTEILQTIDETVRISRDLHNSLEGMINQCEIDIEMSKNFAYNTFLQDFGENHLTILKSTLANIELDTGIVEDGRRKIDEGESGAVAMANIRLQNLKNSWERFGPEMASSVKGIDYLRNRFNPNNLGRTLSEDEPINSLLGHVREASRTYLQGSKYLFEII